MPFQPPLPFADDPEPAPLLLEELARVCRERPLEEKILVAPSLAVGYTIVERLAREGHPWIHLHPETVRTLASRIAGPDLAREGWKVLSRAQALALVELSCIEALGASGYFGRMRERPGLHRALHATLDELRAAGLTADALPARAFADAQKRRELGEVLRRYEAALTATRSVDGIEMLRRAHALLENRPAARGEAVYLVPSVTELSRLERAFLERLAAGLLLSIRADPPESWIASAKNARLLRALGEENEIREVFRRILAEGIPFDEVEVLHTDPSVYPALTWELSCEQAIPCTFAGGIAVTYTRPGQAALAFLDWIGQGFAADVLARALSSGALTFSRCPGWPPGPGARGAARALREAGIGWGRQRHARRLAGIVAELEKPESRSAREAERTESERARRAEARAARLEAARQAQSFVQRALELAPETPQGRADLRPLARAARTFISEFGRVSNDLDAAAGTALDTLFLEFSELAALDLDPAVTVERLRDAVARLSIAPDRPRPGRVHVAFFRAGGFSGRRHTFLVGLDEARVPGPDLEDPILLDEERRRINRELAEPLLALGRDHPREASTALRAAVARGRGTLTASYSSFRLRNLSQSGEIAPSAFFLDLFRERAGRPEADYQELARALSSPAGFAPREAAALDETEWWLSRLSRGGHAGAGLAPAVRAVYPWLEDGHRAQLARASDEFTAFDGWVRRATPELDPRRGGEPFSPTRVQDLARCPFAYFLRHVLHVEPPQELERDRTRWLSPMDEGSLLHQVFKDFFEELAESGQKPGLERHLDRLLQLASQAIAQWSDRIPPRSDLALSQRRDSIFLACRTFLRREEEHCRSVTPRYFEVSFGLSRGRPSPRQALESAEPVEIAVAGASFRLRGSIDRVDEAPDGSFHVWDYKTGSAARVREGAGLRGGRQIQPALYAMALETLLERAGRPGRVSLSGYFFPGRWGEGLRTAEPPDREHAREILRRLFDLVAAGMFPHALSPEDCGYCDFESICGGAKQASDRAKAKLEKIVDGVLAEFRKIHADEQG